MNKRSVLLPCKENSIRSQMAEGLLQLLARDQFEVNSAGLNPKRIHHLTHLVMKA
jgi:protein-tyrosine-phosphatase